MSRSATVVVLAALLGAVTFTAATKSPTQKKLPASYAAGVCKATDGDTVRCGEERIRLVEIDSPEMPGHCRAGRDCAPGDPKASKANVARLLAGGQRVRVVRYAKDRYGRTVGDVRLGRHSLSCLQIRGGYAIKQLKWADYGVTRKGCP